MRSSYRSFRSPGLVHTAGILLMWAAPSLAQTASSIVVEGNRRVEADTIRSYFKTSAGDRLDAAKIDAGLKALYATNLFRTYASISRVDGWW